MKQNFSDILSRSIDIALSKINTAIPGRIEEYDSSTRKATVKPLIKKNFKNGDVLSLPTISNVPVMFPGTADAGIVFPISKGDGCLLVFSQRSLEGWLSEGGDFAPLDNRKFSLTDAIAIPGLFDFKNAPDYGDNGNTLKIKYKDSTYVIEEDGTVKINGGGKEAARKTDAVLSNSTIDSTYWAWLAGLITVFSTWVPVPSDGGTALKTLLTAYIGANPTPTKLDSEINEGSDTVEIGD